jgi:hypothetical protein
MKELREVVIQISDDNPSWCGRHCQYLEDVCTLYYRRLGFVNDNKDFLRCQPCLARDMVGKLEDEHK